MGDPGQPMIARIVVRQLRASSNNVPHCSQQRPVLATHFPPESVHNADVSAAASDVGFVVGSLEVQASSDQHSVTRVARDTNRS